MNLFKSTKGKVSFVLTLVFIMSMSVMAFADTTTHDMTAVTDAFSGLSSSLMTVLASVGAIAVGIMAVFLGWKYGRKLFTQVAK